MVDAAASLRLTRAECPDEQILIAFLDGVLFSADRDLVADHVARCSACEARLASMRPHEHHPLIGDPRVPRGRTRSWLPAIAGGGVLALGIWLLFRPAPAQFDQEPVVSDAPPERPTAAEPPAASAIPGDAIATQGEPGPAATSEPPVTTAPPPTPAETSTAEGSRGTATGNRDTAVAPSGPPSVRTPVSRPAPTPTSAPPAAPAPRALSIASPDVNARWRVDGALIEYSTDGGKKWSRQRIATAAATVAGDAPAATVCWLVGRAGTVLITTDGTTWRAAQAPDGVDLTAVAAMDALNATAVAIDGRRFTTTDGGTSWLTSQ